MDCVTDVVPAGTGDQNIQHNSTTETKSNPAIEIQLPEIDSQITLSSVVESFCNDEELGNLRFMLWLCSSVICLMLPICYIITALVLGQYQSTEFASKIMVFIFGITTVTIFFIIPVAIIILLPIIYIILVTVKSCHRYYSKKCTTRRNKYRNMIDDGSWL